MKKFNFPPAFIMMVFSCQFLVSCKINDDETMSITWWGWLIIVTFIVLIAITIIDGNKKKKKAEIELSKKGLNFSDFKCLGMYASGHPLIDNSRDNVYVKREGDDIVLYTEDMPDASMPVEIKDSNIPIQDITAIKVEDASTVEKKVTLGRMVLVGIFALAWKKKKKNEMAFVNIVWKKGKFENDTTFMFQGKDAAQKANKARNELIKMCE
jgi:hypothetical protein